MFSTITHTALQARQMFWRSAIAWVLAAALVGCAELPDVQALVDRHHMRAVHLENAHGQLSHQQSAAIIARLGRQADGDMLPKQIALEEAIVGSPLMTGNKVTLLQDGPATYKAMLAAIAKARDHINMESYIIEDDEVGERFAEALLERQARGVQVNIIYDSIGTINTTRAYFDKLAAAGVKVLEFNPVNPLAARKAWSPNHRDHRKLLIVDGATVVLGGINVSSVYSSGSAVMSRKPPEEALKKGWRDTDVIIDGPVVSEFQKLFLDTWQRQKGPTLPAKNYYPKLGNQGDQIVHAIGSTPDDASSLYYVTLVSAITNAEKNISIACAYFVPDPQLVQALTDAARRGVDVKLLLPSFLDSGLVFHAGRASYDDLLVAGVRIYERDKALLHAKTITIDGVWSTVGSSNLDWRSFLDNDEVNAVILGHDFARQMDAAYARDLTQSSEVKLAAWRDRPLSNKLKEWMAHWWENWL